MPQMYSSRSSDFCTGGSWKKGTVGAVRGRPAPPGAKMTERSEEEYESFVFIQGSYETA